MHDLVTTGVIFDVKRFAVHDGPGIRTTVFLKGCPLRCQWCHNPESWYPTPEMSVRRNLCLRCGRCVEACPHDAITLNDDGPAIDAERCQACGACVSACPSGAREILGRPVSVDEVIARVERDVPFYDQSGGGVTFSGGEPMAQVEFLGALLARCKAHDLHTAVDTSCHASWEAFKSILPNVDLFLCDVKHADAKIHEQITGVTNELLIENLKQINKSSKRIFLRFPVIPGVNDDLDNVDALGRLASSLGAVARIDILPYNETMQGKLTRLTGSYELVESTRPSDEHVRMIADRLEGFGLAVKIGG